jgi:hypothetical protein
VNSWLIAFLFVRCIILLTQKLNNMLVVSVSLDQSDDLPKEHEILFDAVKFPSYFSF